MAARDHWPVRVGGRTLVLSRHALERYQERVKPTLEGEALVADLRRVIVHAEVVERAPGWVRDEHAASSFVVLGDAIVFPVVAGSLATCLTRSGIGDESRSGKARARRERAERRSQPGVRKKHGRVERDARRRRRAGREPVDG